MTFTISGVELERIKAFQDKYRSKDPAKEVGCIDGQFTYSFQPTSLGDIIIIKDSVSGASENVTDFDNW